MGCRVTGFNPVTMRIRVDPCHHRVTGLDYRVTGFNPVTMRLMVEPCDHVVTGLQGYRVGLQGYRVQPCNPVTL